MSTGDDSRAIVGDGTSEAEWLGSGRLQALPEIAWEDLIPAEAARVVVVAPHPDDEVLPCGGLLAQWFSARRCERPPRPLMIIAVTDGEGSHGLDSTLWPPARLRAERPRETVAALRQLGANFGDDDSSVESDTVMHRLSFPDSSVAACGDPLRARLSELLQPGDAVFTMWRLDGHPDHEATAAACGEIAATIPNCRLIEMPIWSWHWARPDNTALPWATAVRLPLPPAARERKRAAIAAFTSQISPDPSLHGSRILSDSTLARFLRPWEIYFREMK